MRDATIRLGFRARTLGILMLVGASAAVAAPVMLSVQYPAKGPGLSLSSEPKLHWGCSKGHRTIVCTATVARGTTLSLRARTRSPAGSASVSAMSLPIDGAAWGGACTGSRADVCRLHMTRAFTVRIDTRNL